METNAINKIEQIASKKFNASKKIRAGTEKNLLTCIKNILSDSIRTTNPLGKSITKNPTTSTEQPDKILLTNTEIGGSVSIAEKLRTDTANRNDPTIKKTTVHLNKATGPGRSDRNHFPIGSLNSGITITRSGRNIYNNTGMNPQGHIVTTIPEYNRANALNGRNLVTEIYRQGMERKWSCLVEEEDREGMERALTTYGFPLYQVTSFKYLRQVLAAEGNAWPEVVRGLWRARKKWERLNRVFSREVADASTRSD